MNNKERTDINRKLKLLKYVEEVGSVSKGCRYFGISRESYYRWKRTYDKVGEAGLINSKPWPENPKLRTPAEIEFPFRIHTVQTDNGHEFQAKFHWHVEDLGIRHVYIKPATPRLNGKVERSHGTDKEEFYQLIEYRDDVDLAKKIQEWEAFYNYQRPHSSLKGKTPYETLKEKISC